MHVLLGIAALLGLFIVAIGFALYVVAGRAAMALDRALGKDVPCRECERLKEDVTELVQINADLSSGA